MQAYNPSNFTHFSGIFCLLLRVFKHESCRPNTVYLFIFRGVHLFNVTMVFHRVIQSLGGFELILLEIYKSDLIPHDLVTTCKSVDTVID